MTVTEDVQRVFSKQHSSVCYVSVCVYMCVHTHTHYFCIDVQEIFAPPALAITWKKHKVCPLLLVPLDVCVEVIGL